MSTFAQIAEEPFPSLLHVCGAEVKRLRSLSSDDDADADAESASGGADRSAGADLSPRRALSTSALPPVQPLNDLGSDERDLHRRRPRGASPPLPKDRLSEKRIRERFYARMRRGPDAGSGSEGEGSPQLPYDHHRSSRREKSYDEAALQRIKHLADRQDAEARGEADGGAAGDERRRELSFDEAAQGRRRLVAEEEKEAMLSPSVRRQLLPTTATGSLTPNKPKKKRRASQSKRDKSSSSSASSSSSSSSAGDDDVGGRPEKAEDEEEEKQRPKEDNDDHHDDAAA